MYNSGYNILMYYSGHNIYIYTNLVICTYIYQVTECKIYRHNVHCTYIYLHRKKLISCTTAGRWLWISSDQVSTQYTVRFPLFPSSVSFCFCFPVYIGEVDSLNNKLTSIKWKDLLFLPNYYISIIYLTL